MLTACICGMPLDSGQMRCEACQAEYMAETDPVAAITEYEWRELERHVYERENERIAQELDALTPSQASAESEPMRQRVNGWPGGKVRSIHRGRRNG